MSRMGLQMQNTLNPHKDIDINQERNFQLIQVRYKEYQNHIDMTHQQNGYYTELAIQEGYSVTFDGQGGIEYFNPAGTLVSENTEVWEAVVMPVVLSDYAENERNKLPQQWNHSLVVGFDYYHYTKDFWLHSWGNVMPYHIDVPGEFTYHKFVGGNWIDYSGGLIFGYKVNKHLGCFVEGKYNKYWNRNWHDFSFGVNYVIF